MRKVFYLFFSVIIAVFIINVQDASAGSCVALNGGTKGCNQHFLGGCFGSQPIWDAGTLVPIGTCMVRDSAIPEYDINTILGSVSCDASSNNETCATDKCPSGGFGLSGASPQCQVYYNSIGTDNTSCKLEANMTRKGDKWDNTRKQCIECSGSNNKGYVWGTSVGIAYTTPTLIFKQVCGADSICDDEVAGYLCAAGKNCDANGKCVAAATCDTNPTVTINPSTQSGLVGALLNYTIDLRNNDDAACPTPSRTFNLTATKPGGTWIDSFVSASLSAAKGGGTNSTTYKLISPIGAAEGNYTFRVNAADAKGSAAPSGIYTVTTCSSNTFIEFDNDKYRKGSMLKISFAVGSAEPTNDFVRCVYNSSNANKWESPISHFLGSGDLGANVSTAVGDTVGTWTTALKAGTINCPAAPSGCIGSTSVVECLVGADCASTVCDYSTNTCVVGGCNSNGICDPGETSATCPSDCGGSPISAPFCESFLVASDAGKLCGTHVVSNAEVLVKGWCCSAANFVAADKITCQSVDPACAGAVVCNLNGTKEAGENCDGLDFGGESCISRGFGGGTLACDASCNFVMTGCVPIPPPPPPCSGPGMFVSPLGSGYCTIGEILTNATNWILSLVASIIILILVIGGLMYISSTGDEEKLRASKNVIFYAVVGLGIILISYALITEVTNILKGP